MRSKDGQQQMFSYIDQWQQSNLSQKAFCHQVNLPYHIFHYWYRRYRNTAIGLASTFIKLDVTSPSVAAHAELILADGKRLLFHQAVSAEYLKALIS